MKRQMMAALAGALGCAYAMAEPCWEAPDAEPAAAWEFEVDEWGHAHLYVPSILRLRSDCPSPGAIRFECKPGEMQEEEDVFEPDELDGSPGPLAGTFRTPTVPEVHAYIRWGIQNQHAWFVNAWDGEWRGWAYDLYRHDAVDFQGHAHVRVRVTPDVEAAVFVPARGFAPLWEQFVEACDAL